MIGERKIKTPHFDAIRPIDCIYAKVMRMSRLMAQAYKPLLTEYQLKGSMMSILFIIGKMPGVNQKTVANALVLDESTMSRDLKKLMFKGWVTFVKGDDNRNRRLHLTDMGYALVNEIAPKWARIHKSMTNLVGKEGLEGFDKVVCDLIE